jgi:hypothetical protein
MVQEEENKKSSTIRTTQEEENMESNEDVRSDDVHMLPAQTCHVKIPLYRESQLTMFQTLSVAMLCLSGLYPQPYLNALFSLVLACLMQFRSLVMAPYFGTHIEYLDGRE